MIYVGIFQELFRVRTLLLEIIYGVVLSTPKSHYYPLLIAPIVWLGLQSFFWNLVLLIKKPKSMNKSQALFFRTL